MLIIAGGCSEDHSREWQEHGTHRNAPLRAPVGSASGFTELSARRTGVGFTNTLQPETWLANRHLVNGSGVALGDVNGDGLPDIFLAAIAGPNALYLNQGGWKFEERGEEAGVTAPERHTTGAVLVDIDGDADLDLLLTSLGGGAEAFVNDGSGRFTEVSDSLGLAHPGGATSMALADVDGDQDLDLYVGYYKVQTVKDQFAPQALAFERVVQRDGEAYTVAPEFKEHYRLEVQGNRLMRLETAEPDRFYLNDGSGRFVVAALDSGLVVGTDGLPLTSTGRHWALTVRLQDLNSDGIPDLFVCNDFESPDTYWLGDGSGGFRVAPAVSLRKTSQSTMSLAVGDVNADGFDDVFLADMLSMHYPRRQRQHQVIPPEVARIGDSSMRPQVMQNMLFIGRGDGTFAEVAHAAGVEASDWTWSSVFLDVDLDGHEDLLLTTGHAYDAMDGDAQMRAGQPGADWRTELLRFPDLDLGNLAFRGHGDGTFTLMPEGWGLGLHADVAHGMALADLDLDGDLDVVINRLNGPAGVFRNGAEAPRIAVRLRGSAPNTQGIGARVRVEGDGLPPRQQHVVSGGLYLSSSEALLTFAARPGATITVRWRTGRQSVIQGAEPGRVYEVYESAATRESTDSTPQEHTPWFAEAPLNLVHHEPPYEDFFRQPLLPRRLSQRGPALALADLDGDGADDILMGTGKGGQIQVAHNDDGTFSRTRPLGPSAQGDIAGIVVLPGGATIVAESNYERSASEAQRPATLVHMEGSAASHIPFGEDVPGPLTAADFNGDGRLDVFAGGHFVPGRYPYDASSAVYRGESGALIRDENMSTPFAGIGLVSGAAAGDLDGDGDADLALAVDWGPIRIFENVGDSTFRDITAGMGLESLTGWWNGVALGDFDGDGVLDIVATNWGSNTPYGTPSQPVVAHFGDLDRNGSVELLESRFDASLEDYGMVRDLRVLSQALPGLLTRVGSYKEFSERSISTLFGDALGALDRREVTTLRHTVFLNRGTHFEARPLPEEAQWAPAFASVVADFDADGFEDLFLSQNFFATPATTPRMDAGRGLVLRGDGQGGFAALAGDVSGIKVYGEQRSAAAGDLDGDGRTDLVVTQNGTSARLFMGQAVSPGLRVMLGGPVSGIGATIRLLYEDGTLGPARVVSAGSGYWSQHALTQVMGRMAPPVSVWVRWSNGEESETPLSPGQRAIRIARP